jgi:uncharacterized membrane protein
MLFCSNCGGPVNPGDAFCGKCGAKQPGGAAAPGPAPGPAPAPGAPPPFPAAHDGLTPQTASTLCYVPWFGLIASIYVLASERFRRDRDTRFHAFQGLYLFVVWLIVDRVLAPIFRHTPFMPRLDWPLRLAVIGAGIFMIVKTSQRIRFSLPVIGELAEKSASEQN